ALMKPVSRSKFAPVTHRIADVMTARVAGCCRNDGISLDTKAVLAGAFVFLFRVNRETAARRRFIRQTNRARRGHKTTIAFHHVNVFLRQGNEHTHFDGSFGLYAVTWYAPPVLTCPPVAQPVS